METIWKAKKSIILLIIVYIVVTIICVCRFIVPNKTYTYSTWGNLTSGEYTDIVLAEHISLPIGIYSVTLTYDTEGDCEYYLDVQDGTVFYGGLLSNGTPIFNGYKEAHFTFWLLEPTEEMSVHITSKGAENALGYGQLTITDTKQEWSVLWFIFSIFGIICATIIRIKYIAQKDGINREKALTSIGLFLTSVYSSLFFFFSRLETGADLGVHLERIESVVNSIRDGVFPIRLESFYPFGYGYAGGIFYCDLFLYIPAIFRIIGFPVLTSYNMFGVLCSVAGVLVAYYCGNKIWNSCYIGLAFSALYNLSVYKIFDSVIRGGTGTLTGFVFLPLLLYGYYCLLSQEQKKENKSKTWIIISVAYSGIICSHILTLEMSILYTVVAFIVFYKRLFRKDTLLTLVKSFSATVILNLWFIIPFFDYYITQNVVIKNVAARTIQERGISLKDLFLIPLVTADSDRQLIYSPLMIILVFLFVILWICGLFRREKDCFFVLAKISSIFSIVSIVLTLKIFPWDYVQSKNRLLEAMVSVIQYPWRFLIFATLFGSVTVVSLFLFFVKSKKEVWILGGMVVLWSLLLSNTYNLESCVISSGAIKLYDNTQSVGYLSGAEYLIWEEGYWEKYPILRQWDNAKSSENVDTWDYCIGDLSATMSVQNNSDKEGYSDISLLLYKGYRAKSDSGELLNCSFGENNVIRVAIPAHFSGSIRVYFQSPIYWRVAEICSLFGWILIVFWAIDRRKEQLA